MNRSAVRLTARLVFLALGAVLCTVAFRRGNHLLGPETGVAYLAVTAGVLWILARSFLLTERPSLVRAAVIAALSVPVGFAMGFPASINPDVQVFINKQATDRAARAELAAVFASDPAFGGLSISTTHLKVVNVTIHGTLKNHPDLSRLRDRIESKCHVVKLCPLHWDVTLREPGQRIVGLDSELFKADR
jgi:hypothetical protein